MLFLQLFQISLGLPLPSWFSLKDYQLLQEFARLTLDSMVYTDAMKREMVGPTIDKFLKNIDEHENGTIKEKIHMYSAHDFNVATFIKAHNFTGTPMIPDFGSAIIVEKLKGGHGMMYIRVIIHTWKYLSSL